MLTAAGENLVFNLWSKDLFLPFFFPCHTIILHLAFGMSTKQGPSCVNTFLMKYRIALRMWMFNSSLGYVARAVVGYHVVHSLAAVTWQSLCCWGWQKRIPSYALGGSVGKFIHSMCPESWAAAPSPWRPPGLCSQWSLQENTGPHLSLYCTNCWGHFEMGLTLQKGPCTACSDYWCERRRRWLLSGTFSAALCPAPASNGIYGVLSQSQMEQPQMQLPHHPPTVPVPPGMAAASPPLSSVVARTQPKPLWDGKFSCEWTFWVREQCGTYVC